MGIRWSQSDYIRLGKAVAEFNKQIAKNETEANKQYLPDKASYRELRDRIQTREGLEAYIQGLKRINLKDAFKLEKLKGGEIITKYQKEELERGKAQALQSLENRLEKIENATRKEKDIPKSTKIIASYKTQEQKDVEAKIREYKRLFKLRGEKFKKLASEIGINQTELKYRRAYVFRQNYMNVMREKYGSFESYKLFLRWANRHKNPVNFFEALPDNEYYPDDLYYQSDNTFSEEDFEAFLETLGMDVEAEKLKEQNKKK